MVKHGEITSPLITAILANRIAIRLETEHLFPGLSKPLDFNERELKIIQQALRLATRALQEGRG
jgi:hypothetical protein